MGLNWTLERHHQPCVSENWLLRLCLVGWLVSVQVCPFVVPKENDRRHRHRRLRRRRRCRRRQSFRFDCHRLKIKDNSIERV